MSAIARDTIYALSSGRPPAAIAVVRISGPRAGDALKALTGRIPDARKAALARVRGLDGEIIDQALALWFPGPHSETGENMAEFHVHGGRAVTMAMLRALGTIAGARLAEPGEFARRAFDNGKIDLTQAEAIADLVDAETEAQARQALRQAGGALAKLYESWRAQLIEAQALSEAAIDGGAALHRRDRTRVARLGLADPTRRTRDGEHDREGGNDAAHLITVCASRRNGSAL